MRTLLLPFVWVLNGFLVSLYVLAAHIAVLLAVAAAFYVSTVVPQEQRRHALAAATLASLGVLFSPPMLAFMVAAMSAVGAVAVRVERYNPYTLSWRMVGALGLYGMMLLGFALYTALGGFHSAELGASYLDAIIKIAVYAYPLGFLALAAQALWVHPPMPGGRPEDLVTTVRTRGKQE
ncbi:MAG TPA: hypothetical protein ENJ54_03215 [Chloroflexi bacterium]|nr:hypothetical protein [Chloroflexota bacterium]